MEKPIRVLVAEDDDDARFLILYHLQREGIVTREAVNGAVALASLSEFKPHAIVTDLSMPGGGGLELVTSVRGRLDRFSDIPIVVFTGRPSFFPEVQALGTFDDVCVLRKPNELQKIGSVVSQMTRPVAGHRR